MLFTMPPFLEEKVLFDAVELNFDCVPAVVFFMISPDLGASFLGDLAFDLLIVQTFYSLNLAHTKEFSSTIFESRPEQLP